MEIRIDPTGGVLRESPCTKSVILLSELNQIVLVKGKGDKEDGEGEG